MSRNIILKAKGYLDRIARNTNPSELAAIHATVLSIMIGVFSAYFLYINSEIRTRQLYAMSVAEDINNIQFNRYFYYPKNDDIFMASGPTDMDRLTKLMVTLSILTTNETGGTKIEGINIPIDPAERAEKILEIINIISHRYPFPKAIDGISGGFSQFRPEPIVFTDFEYLNQWLKDLDKVIKSLKTATTFMPLYFPEHLDSYFRALAVREKDNITKAKENLPEQIRGERNPYNIFNEFVKNMYDVENIYYSTLVEINRTNDLQNSLASKPFLLIVIFSGFIIFIIGVVLPLSSISLNPLLYIHLPLFFYTVVYISIITKIAIK